MDITEIDAAATAYTKADRACTRFYNKNEDAGGQLSAVDAARYALLSAKADAAYARFQSLCAAVAQ